jgi:hypothetical protein
MVKPEAPCLVPTNALVGSELLVARSLLPVIYPLVPALDYFQLVDRSGLIRTCARNDAFSKPTRTLHVRFKMRPRWHQPGCGLPANFASTSSVLWFIPKTLLQFVSRRN